MQKRMALRVRRAALDLNQFEAAAAAGMGRDRFLRIELGYADPTPDEERAIARALKCKRADLFPEVAEATR